MEIKHLSIDVILRTYNRAAMLGEAVASILAADRLGIALRLLVVDNNSQDETPKLLAILAAQNPRLVVPLHEIRPGGNHALNCAIAQATADIVACFDDDERVAPDWLQAIKRAFSDSTIDFIAGPCRPLWSSPEPGWLPTGLGGVLGIIDNGDIKGRFGPGFSGMLTQGNCALRRSVLLEAGPYPDQLVTAEDKWLFDWLLANDKTGYYCPDLVIFHLIQESRLTRSYFRQWAKREGRDQVICDRMSGVRNRATFPWYWRRFATLLATYVREALFGRIADRKAFEAELHLRTVLAHLRSSLKKRGQE